MLGVRHAVALAPTTKLGQAFAPQAEFILGGRSDRFAHDPYVAVVRAAHNYEGGLRMKKALVRRDSLDYMCTVPNQESVMTERLFKVLSLGGTPCHGGTGVWSLPQGDGPGAWMPPIVAYLIPCTRGYHLCRERDLLRWLGPAIYEAEERGARTDCDDKIVVAEARLLRRCERWTEQTARLFACDCAERVVHLCGNDARPREAIATTRRYARGEATEKELDAASDAASDAARGAAWGAAWGAARAAAWDAASDAASDAARAAAWGVARAAARGAAWAAARGAASDAAWGAEYAWQTERLMAYLDGTI